MADKRNGNLPEEQDNTEKLKKKKGNKVWRGIKLSLQILFLLLLIGVLIAVLVFYARYGKGIMKLQDEAKRVVAESTEESFRQSETTLIYYDDGTLMSKLKGEKDTYYLDYEKIPDLVVKAMVAIEDKKFFKHNGIDLKASMRAAVELVKNRRITQGGSTITMQLSKLTFLTSERSWERKIREMYIAMELEKKYSKAQIMEFYLNNVYFMNGYYGIQAAAKGYFGKNANKLSLAQIAFLCAIPNSPSYYDPLTHQERTEQRQGRILDQMEADGYITASECAAAKAEKITVKRPKAAAKRNSFETYVHECAIRALMTENGFVFENQFQSDEDKEDYDEAYNEAYTLCKQRLYNNGYRIYTSINKKKQKKLQKQVNLQLSGHKGKTDGIYDFQGAAVCINNKTGRVVAIVGGRSQKILTGFELNRAYQSYRQPGSSIKPILVYTPMFERGYTPATMVTDEPIKDGPKNSSGTYSGEITMRYAVEQSKNTVAWNLFQELTPGKGLDYLLDMGFRRIDEKDYGLASALGGLTYGVSVVEMTSAYAALANDGKFREPTCIVEITDADGKVVVSDNIETMRIYEKNAARIMTDVLQGVLTKGTAKGRSLSATASAGKTGTTNDKKDGWFMGYTRYYTTGVWVGYDMPKYTSDLSGATYPLSIWYNFMQELHKNKQWKDFEPYEDKDKDDSDEQDFGYDQEDDIYDDGDYQDIEPEEDDEDDESVKNDQSIFQENDDQEDDSDQEQEAEPVPDEPDDNPTEPDEPDDDYEQTPEVPVTDPDDVSDTESGDVPDDEPNDDYEADIIDSQETISPSQEPADEPQTLEGDTEDNSTGDDPTLME